MRTLALAFLPLLLLACKGELVCPTGKSDCGGRCVSLSVDPANCGACGTACGTGLACGNGTCSACAVTCTSTRGCQGEVCQPDLFVGCPASSELVPVAADLSAAGPGRPTTAGVTALASAGGILYSAGGIPAATVDIVPQDPSLAASHASLAGTDLEGIAVHGGAVFVSNAFSGTLVVLSLSGTLLDELAFPGQQSGANPHGIAFVGDTAYVALTGIGPGTGQAVGLVDLTGLAACTAETSPPACGAGDACASGRHCVAGSCRLPCGSVSGSIDLAAVAGSSDAPGVPAPGRTLAVGSNVYVALANLNPTTYAPAGSGRLAVIDTAASNAVSIVDLGAACGNAGGLALHGTTLWVSCGSFGDPANWPGRLVPVELSGAAPRVRTAVSTGTILPNGLRFCGDRGFAGDMASGQVLPFDPLARTAGTAVDVCPKLRYAYVADVVCAP